MKITLLDGSIKNFEKAMTVKDIASSISISLGKATIGAFVNNNPVSTEFIIDKDSSLELITNKSGQKYEEFLNHTAAFVTSIAINVLYKNSLNAETFYKVDDKEFSTTFFIQPRINLDALEDIQKKVNELLKVNHIEYGQMDLINAKKLFRENKYQIELARKQFNKVGYVSVYKLDKVSIVNPNGIILDLQNLKEIEIQQLTGSYWMDDSKNEMLQRVHGMVGISHEDLINKKHIIEEQRSRDHRNINKTLDIFGFDNLIGPGLPIWMPNGTIIKDEIKKYLKEKEWDYDYIQIQTPVIGTVDLYKTSGHWDHYRDDMFKPFTGGNHNDEEFVLRPMNCPHHISVYKQNLKSYRDLPYRLSEHALQHRYESSGSLTGLERVRAMELTDSHIFARPDQIENEFKNIYKLISEVLKTFNIEIDYLSFSVHDPHDKEKYFNDDNMWNKAEAELEKVLKDLKLNYKKMVGEAAFYGPKLDIQIKTAQNHEITVSTIQLDFLLPKKFDITYIDKDQKLQRPIMIHRGLIGTYERFIAILLEQTKGKLPLWLAPNQIEIIPIGNESNFEYAKSLQKELKKEFIRTHIDFRDERLSWKIREAQMHKIPYQLVIGNNETKDKTITYRQFGSEEQKTIAKSEFVKMIKNQIESKK